jgi:PAS domain S-box-containing protein
MPEVDGLEVLATIKESSPETPIIVVSGTGIISDAIDAVRLGAWDFLLKPIADLSILRHAVESALERARLLRENREYQARLESEVAARTSELRRANAELQTINQRLRRIVESTRSISVCTGLNELSTRLLEEFGAHMAATGGCLYIVESNGLRLAHTLDPGHAPDFIPFPLRPGSVLSRALEEGKPVLIRDVEESDDVVSSGWDGYQNGSVLAFPLPNELGQTVGLLSLHSRIPPPFLEQDREIGSILASYSSEALRVTRASEALRASEEHLRAILESTGEGILVIDRHGRVTHANQRFAEMMSIPDDLLAERNEDCTWRFITEQLLIPEAGLALTSHIHQSAEAVSDSLMLKDGRIIELFSCPLIKSTEVIGRVWSFRDISQRKQAEATLERLGKAIDHTSDVILTSDPHGVITYTNPAFERVTGYRRDQVIGRKVSLLKSGKHDQQFYRDLWMTITSGRSWRGRITNKRRDGTLFTEQTTISPVLSESGEVVSYVKVSRDISAELGLEEQLRQAQKMELFGRITGGVAHDFNNLLTPILGFVDVLLLSSSEHDPGRDKLLQVRKAAGRARDLTRQLLAFGRKQVLEMKPADLNRIVTDFHKMLRRTIREDIDIAVELRATGNIMADVAQIEQVLMNLAVNAQDAMPHGGKLTIRTDDIDLGTEDAEAHPELRPGPMIELVVSDTGCGIDADSLQHVFEPFFTTKEDGKGTGLGLATVHGIVKQHDGCIMASSRPDEGTTLKLVFPRIIADTKGAGEQQARPRPPTGRETVMVVEDDEQVRILVTSVLEMHGYSVIEASNAEECLCLADEYQGTIHLLITDVVMPGMNGRELYECLFTRMPQLKVLFMSGHAEETIYNTGVLDRDTTFLHKPISMHALTEKVREILERRADP